MSAGQRAAAGAPGPVRDRVPEDLYGSWSPSPSPDGKRVAFVSDRGGEPQVWFAGPAPLRWSPLPAALRRMLHVTWSPTGQWLACVTAAPGASRHEVWLVRPDGGDLHRTAGAGRATAVLGAGRWHGWTADGRLLVTETQGGVSSALLVDPSSGERQTLAVGPLLSLLDVSPDGARALLRRGPRGRRRLTLVDTATGRQDELGPHEGDGSVDHGVLSADAGVVFCRSDVDRDFAALVALPTSGGAGRVLAARDGAELQNFTLSADGGQLALLWNVDGGYSAVTTLDVASGTQAELGPLPRDVVDECRFTLDSTLLLLTAENWADPRGVWSVDLATGATAPVSSTGHAPLRSSRGSRSASIDVHDIVAPQLRRLRSHDGLELSGWLYTPHGTAAPWPTMIYLHGGPEAQERPVYSSLFQSLLAAGVAVFAANVRGSTGFGRSFLQADDLDRRFAAIDDVAACAEHLTTTGVAGSVGCMGRSYGGYLTLAALVRHPELFAVGVDVCGMSNFETFYEDTEVWIAAAAISEYGDPQLHADLLRALSPIHRIERLRAPLLVVHGAQDTNVPVRESRQVVDALTRLGVEHRFLLFEGEGHELLSTANRVAFVHATVDWVTQHLADASSGAAPGVGSGALSPSGRATDR